MTKTRLLWTAVGSVLGMVVASGAAVWAMWPHARPQTMAWWLFAWCATALAVAAVGLYWWEDEPEAEPAAEA